MLLVMLTCVLVPRVIAQQSDRGDVQGTILALERIRKMQATQLKDLKILGEILDENFVSIAQDGMLMNKPEVLAYVQKAGSLRIVSGEMNVRLHGKCAIVTGVYQLNGVIAGKIFTERGRFVDTWVEKNGKWVEIASLSTPAA